MNREGYKILTVALHEAGMPDADIVPVPDEDQDARYVSVNTGIEDSDPTVLLNILEDAGLIYAGVRIAKDSDLRNLPQLVPLFPGLLSSIIFEDKSATT